jgi:hypothetical protein
MISQIANTGMVEQMDSTELGKITFQWHGRFILRL